MQFTELQMSAFKALSGDDNPLHCDENFSRTTPFGAPIVYGMAAVVWALARWANGRSFRLNSLWGRFNKPLYPNTPYRLEFGSTEPVKVTYFKGSVPQFSFTFTTKPTLRAQQSPWVALSSSGSKKWHAVRFSANTPHKNSLLDSFDLHPDQLPAQQLDALLWSSYFVGTQCPGKQALFASFHFEFGLEDPPPALALSEITAELDERFNLYRIDGIGPGVTRLHLEAFERPAPKRYTLTDARSSLNGAKFFGARRVWISGASRGFGAATAMAFGLRGADLILHGYRSGDDLKTLCTQLKTSNCVVDSVQNDLLACRSKASLVPQKLSDSPIDIIVHNAFGVIRPAAFFEQSADEIARFIDHNIRMSVLVFSTLLPQLRQGGIVIYVSSEYTKHPRPLMSHYTAAKSAIESIVHGLSLEIPDRHFAIVRPPKMVTDQTFGITKDTQAASPITLAGLMVDKVQAVIDSNPKLKNFHEWNL